MLGDEAWRVSKCKIMGAMQSCVGPIVGCVCMCSHLFSKKNALASEQKMGYSKEIL